MKKIFLMLFILFLGILNIKAYENDYFKIEIPEVFIEDESESGVYKWSIKDKADQIIITVSKNDSTSKHNIENYTEDEISEYEKYLEDKINNELKDYKIVVDVSNIKKTTIKDYIALEYDIIWPTKDSFGYDAHQKGYTFTTNNYIITYTYTSDKEINDENEYYSDSIDSFQILDAKIKDDSFFSKKLNRLLVVGGIAGAIGYALSALKKRK